MSSTSKAALFFLLFVHQAVAEDPRVHLIDAHGISVSAIVPDTNARELLLDIDFTPLGRDLLLESQTPKTQRPKNHEAFAKLGPGDAERVAAALLQCHRWHDHFFDNKDFPAEQLRTPEFTVKKELTVVGNAKRYTGKCEDDYWLTFRKPQDTALWRFDAGRRFKGERANITVRLRYDYQEDGNLGEIVADGKPVFTFDPREETYNREFTDRFLRSRLWEQVDTRSFELARDRLTTLLGNKFDIVIGIMKTHPEQTSQRLLVRPGIYATNSFIKAIEVMTRERLLVESSKSIEGGVKADQSVLMLPGAMLAREQLNGRLAVDWTDKRESEKERKFRVEFGKLKRVIEVDRSAYLYLCVLHQAMSGVRLSTSAEVKQMVLEDVLAEAEWKLDKPPKGDK